MVKHPQDIQEEIPTDSTAGSTLMRSVRERHSPDYYGVEANTVDTRAVTMIQIHIVLVADKTILRYIQLPDKMPKYQLDMAIYAHAHL